MSNWTNALQDFIHEIFASVLAKVLTINLTMTVVYLYFIAVQTVTNVNNICFANFSIELLNTELQINKCYYEQNANFAAVKYPMIWVETSQRWSIQWFELKLHSGEVSNDLSWNFAAMKYPMIRVETSQRWSIQWFQLKCNDNLWNAAILLLRFKKISKDCTVIFLSRNEWTIFIGSHWISHWKKYRTGKNVWSMAHKQLCQFQNRCSWVHKEVRYMFLCLSVLTETSIFWDTHKTLHTWLRLNYNSWNGSSWNSIVRHLTKFAEMILHWLLFVFHHSRRFAILLHQIYHRWQKWTTYLK